MEIILIEIDGGLHDVKITEEEVAHYLGGIPLTFCGTIQELDIVVMTKKNSTSEYKSLCNPRYPVVSRTCVDYPN